MPISGLLITLSADEGAHLRALATLATRREIEMGQRLAQWLPAVIETADDAGSRELHDWIQAQPGVEYVDVVSVDFAEEENGPPQQEFQP